MPYIHPSICDLVLFRWKFAMLRWCYRRESGIKEYKSETERFGVCECVGWLVLFTLFISWWYSITDTLKAKGIFKMCVTRFFRKLNVRFSVHSKHIRNVPFALSASTVLQSDTATHIVCFRLKRSYILLCLCTYCLLYRVVSCSSYHSISHCLIFSFSSHTPCTW